MHLINNQEFWVHFIFKKIKRKNKKINFNG